MLFVCITSQVVQADLHRFSRFGSAHLYYISILFSSPGLVLTVYLAQCRLFFFWINLRKACNFDRSSALDPYAVT